MSKHARNSSSGNLDSESGVKIKAAKTGAQSDSVILKGNRYILANGFQTRLTEKEMKKKQLIYHETKMLMRPVGGSKAGPGELVLKEIHYYTPAPIKNDVECTAETLRIMCGPGNDISEPIFYEVEGIVHRCFKVSGERGEYIIIPRSKTNNNVEELRAHLRGETLPSVKFVFIVPVDGMTSYSPDGSPTDAEAALANKAVIMDQGVTDSVRAELVLGGTTLFGTKTTSIPSLTRLPVKFLDYRTIIWTTEAPLPGETRPTVMLGMASYGGASLVPMQVQIACLLRPMITWSSETNDLGIAIKDWHLMHVWDHVTREQLKLHHKQGKDLFRALGEVIDGTPPFSLDKTQIVLAQVSHYTQILGRGLGLIEIVATMMLETPRIQQRWQEEIDQAEGMTMQRVQNLTEELALAKAARDQYERGREAAFHELYQMKENYGGLQARLASLERRNNDLEAQLATMNALNNSFQSDFGQGSVDPRLLG